MTNRIRSVIYFALFAFAPLVSLAQEKPNSRSGPLTEAPPAQVGVSAERLERISTALQTAIKENRIPGAVALVARRGKIVYHQAFGMADNEARRELKKDDIFRIASQSKAITATAVMILWEEGRFQLDDPISKWIPAFEKAGVLK